MDSFLNKTETKRAKMLVNEINDYWSAIENEVFNAEQPAKSYLLEKIQPILHDMQCLLNLMK